jgi:hypothetical protein
MNSEIVSEDVRQFLGSRFHQDWDLAAKDSQEAVDKFSCGVKPTKLLALAQEIDTVRNAYNQDELGLVMYRQAWCSYNPRPLTFRDSMGQVADDFAIAPLRSSVGGRQNNEKGRDLGTQICSRTLIWRGVASRKTSAAATSICERSHALSVVPPLDNTTWGTDCLHS